MDKNSEKRNQSGTYIEIKEKRLSPRKIELKKKLLALEDEENRRREEFERKLKILSEKEKILEKVKRMWETKLSFLEKKSYRLR